MKKQKEPTITQRNTFTLYYIHVLVGIVFVLLRVVHACAFSLLSLLYSALLYYGMARTIRTIQNKNKTKGK